MRVNTMANNNFNKIDEKTKKHILNVLRRGTVTWHGRNECLNKYRKKVTVGKYLNGKPKTIFKHQCQHCFNWFLKSELEVDHIEEVGPFEGDIEQYILRMYCSIDNLQPLCGKCHLRKTSNFNSRLKCKRKKEIDLEDYF